MEMDGTYDTVLVAVGRDALTKDLGLEAAGVEYSADTGKIPATFEQTNVENIYAIETYLERCKVFRRTARVCAFEAHFGMGSAKSLGAMPEAVAGAVPEAVAFSGEDLGGLDKVGPQCMDAVLDIIADIQRAASSQLMRGAQCLKKVYDEVIAEAKRTCEKIEEASKLESAPAMWI